ncbi:hypothetical protein EV714DRAFT_240453, partial [Schizophyllum commune]
MPAPAPAAPAASAAPAPAASTPSAATVAPGTKSKRKRPVMDKKDRKNNKNWASGVREQILLAHLPKFTQELARGVKYAREYLVKILHEFNFKISYEFPDDVDPNPVPEYDLENPPPLPALSAEDEVKRAEALRIRDKRVWDWLLYRARKIVPAQPKGADDTNNPYT